MLRRHVAKLEASTTARPKAAAGSTIRRFKEFHDAAASWSRVNRIIAGVARLRHPPHRHKPDQGVRQGALDKHVEKGLAQLKIASLFKLRGAMFTSRKKFDHAVARMLEKLNHNRNNLILSPNRVRDLYKKTPYSNENVMFRINEREFQSEFLTIWPIILDPAQLRKMAKLLAYQLQQIRIEFPFNRIVSCSPTMRYFLEELSVQLKSAEAPIFFDYFGLHPMQASQRIAQYTSSDLVLIISDVIATGRMIDEMRSTVQLSGGQVVGSFSVFKATYHDSVSSIERFAIGEITSDPTAHSALFQARMKNAQKPNIDVKEVTVDRTTVYPSLGERDENFEPLISESVLLAKPSKKKKPQPFLKFGTFSTREKWISINYDIDGVLKACRPVLDKNIKKIFRKHLSSHCKTEKSNKRPRVHIITTPGHDNRVFTSFIAKILRDECRLQVHYIPRSETLSEQYSYFVPRALELPTEDTVFLCLATVNTSEKLRALSAYLAMSGLRKIFVITLLNRMNFAAGSFLSRVVNLRTGNDRGTHLLFEDSLQPSDFRYSTMFQVFDLTTQDMLRTEDFAKDAINSYLENNVGGSFRLQAENELKYFSPQDGKFTEILQPRFLNLSESGNRELEEKLNSLGYDLKHIPETVVYPICLRECVENRNFDFVTPLFFTRTSKELRYCVLRLLILNAALLNVSGFSKYIRHELLVFLKHLETQKRKFTSRSAFMDGNPIDAKRFDRGYKRIRDITDQQIQTMISLAFLARTDLSDHSNGLAQDTLEYMLRFDDRKGCVEACYCSASNPSYLWAITFLANALGLTPALSPEARIFARTLRDELNGRATNNREQSISDVFLNVEDVNGETDTTTETSAWLNEFLAFFVRDEEVAMRMSYLTMMSSVADRIYNKDRVRHINQYQKIYRLETELKQNSNSSGNSDSFYMHIDGPEEREAAKLAVSSCAHALSDLKRTADYVDHLLRRSEVTDEWADYFVSAPHSPSAFRSDLEEFFKIIQPIRMNYRILRRDLTRADKVRNRLIKHVWNPNDEQFVRSELWRFLQAHTFKFCDVLAEARKQANEFICRVHGDQDVWQTKHLKLVDRSSEFIGFGNRSMVLTALENALQNIRHQIQQDQKFAYHRNNFISTRFEKSSDVDRQYLLITIGTFGTSQFLSRPRGNRPPTWQTDQSRLRQFDGDISYEPTNDPSPGVVSSLKIAASPFGAIYPEITGEGS